MSLKSGLYNYLSGLSGLSALVATRIYPDMAPAQADLPYIVYSIVSSEHVRHTDGASNFASRRVQFDVYGASALSVDNVFMQLRAALESKLGTIGTGPNQVVVISSGIESERDDYIAPTDGGQVGKHRRMIDFIIWHRL